MTRTITIRKGLDIKLKGESERIIVNLNSDLVALKPIDFHGVLPKLLVSEGDDVVAGTALFYDKHNEQIIFTSPVSGVVHEIRRGAKRLLEAVVIKPDGAGRQIPIEIPDLSVADVQQIKQLLLVSGLWPKIRQRPYNVIAHPEVKPRGVFISAFDTAPLAPDFDFVLGQRGHEFQVGLDLLSKLSGAPVHLGIHVDRTIAKFFTEVERVNIHRFKGPHPVGNVGVQLHHIEPLNKGEVVWTVHPVDVADIGRFFLEKKINAERLFAFAGSEVTQPRYYRAISGASILSFPEISDGGNNRLISGNVLTGGKIERDGFAGFYDHVITVIPEGNHHAFMGWAKPGFSSWSFSGAFPSKLFRNKVYRLDTNLNGGARAFVITGQYEKVLPMDIYPMQLLKAILIKDIDLMENLGIYEVDEEDFALCEVICTSKTEVQSIIRDGLDLIRKEMS